ncbi:Crp/Fnr family transcriptional regulator [Chitinophaga sp. Hz27]|uniref:Crp/Fnr family transcriptional regulator n=1 Tax=Chitinophaga sp. Hz27 TaxID=3347169 RepID=UPI0035DE0933
MQQHHHCFLSKYSLPEWQAAITTNATIHKFKRGTVIFRETEAVTGFYFIHSGKVKVHKQWGEDNRDLIVKFALAGDILGHRGLGQDHFYPVTATVIEDVEACFISAEFFHTTLLVNHELAYHMVLFYATELQKAEQAMRDMVFMSAKSKMANALLKIQDIFGTDESGAIQSNLSRQEIASYAGTTYETLFKTLNEWIEEGIIAVSGKSITIRDQAKLRALLQ